MKKNNENNEVKVERLFQLFAARVSSVDTRSTMRTDVTPLFEMAMKEAKTALAVFEREVGNE